LSLKITIALLFTLKNLLMIIYVFKNMTIFLNHENYMGEMVRAGAGATIFDKLELEPHKNVPDPQHFFFF
jgi:hypothetical protein